MDVDGSVVQGLMVIGEAACVSVHGANRLGSNSLLDLIVFGRAAAHRISDIMKNYTVVKVAREDYEHIIDRFDKLRFANGANSISKVRSDMQQAMQCHAAVFREHVSLTEGQIKVRQAVQDFADVRITDRSMIWNSDMVDALELHNLLLQSLATIDCATNRHESRGSHAREDYPERDDVQWLKHSMITFDQSDWSSSISYKDVVMTTLTDDVMPVALKKRTY